MDIYKLRFNVSFLASWKATTPPPHCPPRLPQACVLYGGFGGSRGGYVFCPSQVCKRGGVLSTIIDKTQAELKHLRAQRPPHRNFTGPGINTAWYRRDRRSCRELMLRAVPIGVLEVHHHVIEDIDHEIGEQIRVLS